MKTCSHCHRELPETEFYNSQRHQDGKMPRCKSCCRASCEKRREAEREKRERLRQSKMGDNPLAKFTIKALAKEICSRGFYVTIQYKNSDEKKLFI